MTNRLKATLIAAACLVCCIPLVVGVLGATTGIAGAIGLWFRRYDINPRPSRPRRRHRNHGSRTPLQTPEAR
jgi:hypothetical protein